MSTRTSSALLFPLVLLGACGSKLPDKVAEARVEANSQARAVAEGRIECDLAGSGAFAPVCTIDRTETQDGLFLTIRHPDGGFRRLRVTKDGRGVVAADGAEPAIVTPVGADRIVVALGSIRYRLPATVRAFRAS